MILQMCADKHKTLYHVILKQAAVLIASCLFCLSDSVPEISFNRVKTNVSQRGPSGPYVT